MNDLIFNLCGAAAFVCLAVFVLCAAEMGRTLEGYYDLGINFYGAFAEAFSIGKLFKGRKAQGAEV